MTSEKDSELIRRLKDRDKFAWNAVSSEYMRDVYGFVVRLVGLDRTAADDIVQEVWLESLKRIQQFDPARGEFRGWLFEIARCRVAGYWRKRLSMPLCEELESAALMDRQLLPTEILDRLDRAAIVRAAMLAMSPERCRVLTAKYQDDLTVAEIAASEGKSVKAIESLLTRARDELRGLLGSHFDSTPSDDAMLHRSCSVRPFVPETHT